LSSLFAQMSRLCDFLAGTRLRGCWKRYIEVSETESESIHDKDMNIFHTYYIPSVDIVSYCNRLISGLDNASSVLVVACIYMDRICANSGCQSPIYKSPHTIHRLLAACTWLGTKYLDDEPCYIKYFSRLSGISVMDLCRLESEVALRLDWRFFVEPEEYARFGDAFSSLAVAQA
jgi:hypothetical protein